MARVEQMHQIELERNTIHEAVQATYTVFFDGDDTYLQIDTYGPRESSLLGKRRQSLQFGPNGVKALRRLLDEL